VRNTVKIAAILLIITACIIASILFFQNYNVAVLNPQGEIADKQRNLMIFTVLLALVVVVPVFTMLALFSWKYREGNKKA
jgi:cytochrome o ubiquinol oxidase subunit 2